MNEEPKYNPKPAMTFASVVYSGVVIAGTTLFISFVLTAFPPDAYLSRVVMVVAGLLIGLSSVAFPVALHTWAFEKTHRNVTIAFYYGEIAIMAVNVVVSFMSLLGKNNTSYLVPEWATLYEPFSVGAIIYTLAAWGTIFLLDPEHKRVQMKRDFRISYEQEVSNLNKEYLGTIQGRQAIARAAEADIQLILSEQRGGVKDFYAVAGVSAPTPAPAVFTKKESTMPPLAGKDGETG